MEEEVVVEAEEEVAEAVEEEVADAETVERTDILSGMTKFLNIKFTNACD